MIGGVANHCRRHSLLTAGVVALFAAIGGSPSAAAAQDPVKVSTESELRRAWEDPRKRAIELTDDIYLRACRSGEPIRESQVPMTVDGNGHTLRQTCFEKRLLRQDGTGYLLDQGHRFDQGRNDGPGAALTTRGD